MRIRASTATSAIGVALFLFFVGECGFASLPLTETILIIPENEIELFLKEEAVQINTFYRRDHVGAGLGLLHSFSLWFEFQYITQGIVPSQKSEAGDIFLKSKFFIGDYFEGRLHIAFLLRFRLPTGKNAYASEDWRNLALGKNEITMGPCFRIDLLKPLYMHLNILYTFREGNSENLYGGFNFDIFKKDAWIKIFGLNPFAEGTFLHKDRLRNDYMTVSFGMNSDILHPFVPFVECYTSFRTTQSSFDTSDVPIEGAGINPVFLVSVGTRYFFSGSIFVGFYTVQNPLPQNNFLKAVYSLEISLQF